MNNVLSPSNPQDSTPPAAVAVVFFRAKPVAHGKVYEIFHGDPKAIDQARYLGYVSQTLDGLNRPMSLWVYDVAEGITVKGKRFNLRAGNSMQQAAIRLARKCGIEVRS
jgi:hypothetical protein